MLEFNQKRNLKLEIADFDISSMLWSQPKYVNMDIDETPFASGGFRNAHKQVLQMMERYMLLKSTQITL